MALRGNAERRRRLIAPIDFYSNEEEKTKLNWFCFEFALELEMFIRSDRKLWAQLRKKKVDDKAIAGFCIHYAKHMKGEVLAKLSFLVPAVRIGYEQIEAYFPSIGDRLVDHLLTVTAKAWDSQTGGCVHCPTRCISEKDEIAPMFFDPYYSE